MFVVGRGCFPTCLSLYCLDCTYFSALSLFVSVFLFCDDSSRTFLFVGIDLAGADSNKHIRLKATFLKKVSLISNLMRW